MIDTPAPGEALADAFDRAARHYDLLVALSPGYHAQLRGSARRLVAALPPARGDGTEGEGEVVLDLGCGTGASTRAVVDALAAARRLDVAVAGVDASAGMIAQAEEKPWPDAVTFTCSDAVADLRGRETGSVSGVFAAYLIRNVPDRDALLAEVARVLCPGAPLVIHEYSVAGSARARLVWETVCRAVIIPTAFLTDRDVRLYHYLRQSVVDFDSIDTLRGRLGRAGFTDVHSSSFLGWQHGIVHTVDGIRT